MLGDAPIRAAVRTGDTPQRERARMRRAAAAHPGHDAGVAVHPAQLASPAGAMLRTVQHA